MNRVSRLDISWWLEYLIFSKCYKGRERKLIKAKIDNNKK